MHVFRELLIPSEFRAAKALLEQAGLDMPEGITFGLGAYENDELAGTGFLAGDVVCGICVAPSGRGVGLAAAIVSRLVQRAMEEGRSHLLLFTKPAEAAKFGEIGFHSLVQTSSAALLEWGQPDYAAWLRDAGAALGLAVPGSTPGAAAPIPAGDFRFPLGAVVMNANPFTLGHRHLVLRALEACSRVAVFVVAEEASAFPFAVRYALVRQGLADRERVTVLPGGSYMVSRASFPAYFTGKAEHSRVHAALDAAMFAGRIAPDLGISARFVGEEPYCPVTATYNAVLRATLPEHGVACIEIPRLAADDAPVSASAVRDLLRRDAAGQEWERLVPASTASFFRSAEAESIVARLRQQAGRH